MSFQIAIDGPVASGKGTIARLVAKQLGFFYLDTGAMYRAVALAAMRAGVALDNEDAVVDLISHLTLDVRPPNQQEQDGRLITVFLNGKDVSWAIRDEKITDGSSKVAVLARVRQQMVKLQQAIAANQNVVVDGRDITYRVLPQAQLKIFLTGSAQARAKRRLLEWQKQGKQVAYEQVYADIMERDKRDSERQADPLQVVPNAWVLDTTDLTIEQVAEKVVARAKELYVF